MHQKITLNLRSEVFEKLQRLSFLFFDSNASGAIITRVSGDVQTLRLFIEGVLMQSIVMLMTLVVTQWVDPARLLRLERVALEANA